MNLARKVGPAALALAAIAGAMALPAITAWGPEATLGYAYRVGVGIGIVAGIVLAGMTHEMFRQVPTEDQ